MYKSVATLLVAVGVFLGIDVVSNPILPRIPGSVNRHVVQSNIGSTVCMKGWTRTIRPPLSFTHQLKVMQISQLGYTDTDTRHYEEDHLIPLELGGNPTSVKNLWPEPWAQAYKSDKVENFLNRKVCNGETSLSNARATIRAYKRVKG